MDQGFADDCVVRIIACLVPVVYQRVPGETTLPEVVWVAEKAWDATWKVGGVGIALNDARGDGPRSIADRACVVQVKVYCQSSAGEQEARSQ